MKGTVLFRKNKVIKPYIKFAIALFLISIFIFSFLQPLNFIWENKQICRASDEIYYNGMDFEEYLDSEEFPESYKEDLRNIHEQYPQWIFKADYTGKDWNEVIENETILGRSLIYGSAISSWKSTQEGAYDWDSGTWYEIDSGGWVQASPELVEYAVDPRNFLNETNIFMFEDLSYNSDIQNENGVKNIISGSFMSSSSHELIFSGKKYSYSSALMYAGKYSGVSPYHLAVRIIQEQGRNGQGQSISGTVSGYEGFYNYYNQGAYKTQNASAVENGMKFAQKTDDNTIRPWNSRMKSIVGGASYIGSKYINKGQNTIYYEKFDLITPYTHQYMSNILAPRSESVNASKAYNDNTKEQTKLIFTIPIYDNMPDEACELPDTDETPVRPDITSSELIIDEDDGIISGISEKSSVSDILSEINIQNKCSVKIYDSDMNKKNDEDIVGTGNILKVYDKDGAEIQKYSLLLYGDVNGDGQITSIDLLYVKRHILGTKELKGVYLKAADANRQDDGITSMDMLYIKRHILGVRYIEQ